MEFDQYPSELVTQVKIYKTPDAGMAYQGIAGTTDIATVHPLASPIARWRVGYKREMNEQERQYSRASTTPATASILTYIDQFMETSSASRSVSPTTRRRTRRRRREPWGYAG